MRKLSLKLGLLGVLMLFISNVWAGVVPTNAGSSHVNYGTVIIESPSTKVRRGNISKFKDGIKKALKNKNRKKIKFYVEGLHWLNIVSLVCGGLSLLLLFVNGGIGFLITLALILSISAIVFGILGLKENGKLMGIVGLTLGFVTIFIFLLAILFIAALLS